MLRRSRLFYKINMKQHLGLSVSLFALVFFSQEEAFAQQKDFVVQDLRDPVVLRTLFDAVAIDSFGEALWKPNFSESSEFPVCYDSLCHTALDTIMEYRTSRDTAAIVLFATWQYYNNGNHVRMSCHACGPLLSIARFRQQPQGWVFQCMRKDYAWHGAWGRRDPVKLQRIGKEEYALELDYLNGGQGYMGGGMTLYDLASFSEMFFTSTHEDNLGADPDGYSWTKTIRFVPATKDAWYYDLVTTTKGTGLRNPDERNSPIVKQRHTNRYRYDSRHYVPVE